MGDPELGGDVSQTNTLQQVWRVTQIVFNILNHAMIAFVAIFMTYKTYTNGNTLISWHVFLCTLGVSEKLLYIPL